MASTFSNLGLNLQATGENSGTWGAITNVNLQDIDCAIGGVITVTVTGNTTLAFTTNSSSTTYSDEAGRNKTIILSGSLTSTTITVTVPNIEKDYVIINNSGATATISSGGSTTVSIATGSKNYVIVDPSTTSVISAVPAATPGGTTNSVQYNSSGSFAGSTNFTFDGTTAAMQTATALKLTVTSLTATNATVTGTFTGTTIVGTNLTVSGTVFGATFVATSVTSSGAITGTTITGTNLTVSGTVFGTTLVATNATVTNSTTVNAVFSSTVNLLTQSELRFQDTSGGEYVGLRASTTVATSFTLNLPTTSGTANQVLQTDGSGNLSFATVSGGAAWQAVKTSSFNVTAKEGYFIDTTSTTITATLPSSPTLGDFVSFIDYAGTFDTNNLTIARNGKNIQGSATDLTVATERAGLTLVYVDTTQGWLLQNN